MGDLDSNTTYAVFTKATASAAGKAGLVPAPGAGKQEDFLRGDGTWQAVVGLVPVGGIVAFSGTFSGRNPVDMVSKKAMTSWCLCDGAKTNGLAVPDLRDRMIMGAGTTYQTGSKGGAATHLHGVSGTVGGTTLTEAQLAKHHHTTVQLPAYGTSKGFPQDAHPGEEKQGIGGTGYMGQWQVYIS